jgi:hypothetical protein
LPPTPGRFVAIKSLNEVINRRQANVEYRFEASIARVVLVAHRIIPGHFPELKREGTAFTPVGPQGLGIQFK